MKISLKVLPKSEPVKRLVIVVINSFLVSGLKSSPTGNGTSKLPQGGSESEIFMS